MTVLADANERPDFVVERLGKPDKTFVVLPLPLWKRLLDNEGLRRALVLVALGLVWQAYATWVSNDLVFPKLSDVFVALWKSTINGVLPSRTWNSLHTLLIGYAVGIGLGIAMTTAAIVTRVGKRRAGDTDVDVQSLPAIALLPLALLWFGLGQGSIISCWHIRCCGRSRSTRIRLPFGKRNAAHGRAQLCGLALCSTSQES